MHTASDRNAHTCARAHTRTCGQCPDRQPRTRPRGAPSPVAHSAGEAIARPQNNHRLLPGFSRITVKDGEAPYGQERQDRELTRAQIISS